MTYIPALTIESRLSRPIHNKPCSDDELLHKVALSNINLEDKKFEYRFVLHDDIARFAEKIKNEGQKFPVVLRGKVPPFKIICGFRRVRSLLLLKEKYVTAWIIPEISDEDAHRLSVLENEERKSLTDLDRANCCKKLYNEGLKQDDIAPILGCSRSRVSKYLGLLNLPDAIFDALKKDRIKTEHALILKSAVKIFSGENLQMCGAAHLEKLIAQIEEKKLSTRELKRLIKKDLNNNRKTLKSQFQRKSKEYNINVSFNPWMNEGEKQKFHESILDLCLKVGL